MWAKMLTHCAPANAANFSGIFEYNYNSQGDPANRLSPFPVPLLMLTMFADNWADHYPTSQTPPSGFPIRVGDEYPLPHWIRPPPDLSTIAIVPKFFERPRSQSPPVGIYYKMNLKCHIKLQIL